MNKKLTVSGALAFALAVLPLTTDSNSATAEVRVAATGASLDAPLAGLALNHRGRNGCKRSAHITLQASLTGARASYFEEIAKCVHKGGNLWVCAGKAYKAYKEDVALARAQYKERLLFCKQAGESRYNPKIDPEDFSTKVTNRYWPLVVGRQLIYRKKTDEETEIITVTVLKKTFEVNGVECAQVRDVVTVDGELLEDTIDWYAQKCNGDVWYIGEIALNYEDGVISDVGGSWRYGKDGALPGIIMFAKPKVGTYYRQEFLLNEAEDVGRVVSLKNTVKVPAGTFKNCLQTEDYSPVEPGIRARKFYAPGVGTVLEVDPDGTRTELIKIVNPK